MTDTLLRRCAVTFGGGAIALAAYIWHDPGGPPNGGT